MNALFVALTPLNSMDIKWFVKIVVPLGQPTIIKKTLLMLGIGEA